MRSSLFGRCFCVLAILMIAERASAAEHCAETEAAGTLISIEGRVEIQRSADHEWHPAVLQQRLCLGDTIRVARHSRAAVVLSDGWIERFDQNSAMRFVQSSDQDERSILDLLYGAVLFFSRSPRGLDVVTPYANAGVEGTEFVIRVEAEQTVITVFEGRVVAANHLGRLLLESGKSAVAEAGKAPEPRLVVRPRDAVHWSLFYPPILAAPDGRSTDVPTGMAEPLRQAIRSAASLLAVGQVTEARAEINRALAQDPKAGLAFALRAIIEVVQNQVDRALTDAERAVELSPRLAAAKIALSYAQQADFQLLAARDSLLQAVEDEPEHALAWARLAELWLMLGYRNRALEAAAMAVALEPNLPRVQLVLGFAALSEFRTIEARRAFERAIVLNSADPLPRLGLGLAKIRESDLAAGRREIEIAVGLDSGNALLRAYLGKAYFEERRAPLDAEQFAIARQLDPRDPTAFLYDGIRLQTENRPVQALESLQQSIVRNDNRAVFRSRLQLDQDRAARGTSLARVYDDLGFRQPGVNEATRSLAHDPASAAAHRFLSDIYRGVRRKEIARVSELLQAQMLQDINIHPIQPSISETNLNIVTGGGPAQASVGEFTPLFERNQVRLNASGVLGNLDDVGGEVVISAVYNQFSLSAGAFHFATDGFRANNQIAHDIVNVYGQMAATPNLNIQAEFRRRESEFGDLALNFDPEQFDVVAAHSLDQDMGRLGVRYSPAPSSDVLVSVIFNDREESLSGISLDNRANDEGYQAEAQYLYRRSRFNVTAGLAYADVDRDFEFSTDQFNTTFTSKSQITHRRGYAYVNFSYPKTVMWTVGVSYDDYDEDALEVEEVNPKFGVQWNITGNLRFRSALFQTVKPALVSNRTIEPTQIAGFNQMFDDVNATRSRVYGIGLDWRAMDNLLVGAEAVWRELEVPIFVNAGVVSQHQDEYVSRAYVNWTPMAGLAVSGELVYDRFEAENGPAAASSRFPEKLATTHIPLAARYFHPRGFFAGIGASYVHQTVRRSDISPLADGTDEFVVVDATVGYRLPGRRGTVSLEVRNLFDSEFKFQDDGFREFAGEPSTGPYIPDSVVLLRVSLNF